MLKQIESVPACGQACRCLADLALAKLDATYAALRDHIPTRWPQASSNAPEAFCELLNGLRKTLLTLRDGGTLDGFWAISRAVDPEDGLLTYGWQRIATVNWVSPDVMVARAHMVNDVGQRAAPTEASLSTHVAVTDVGPISDASLAGWLSGLLIMAVALFLWLAPRYGGSTASPDVLAFVLTLFAVVQASRINWNSATLPGVIARTANVPTIAVIGPTATLAIALAFFYDSDSTAFKWAIGCLVAQLLLQGVLEFLVYLRRWASHYNEETTIAPKAIRPIALRRLVTEPCDYSHNEVLRSAWLRSVTAAELRNGRPAYGYLVWQQGKEQGLDAVIASEPPAHEDFPFWHPLPPEASAGPDSGGSGQPAHVLALLRGGTSRQSLNFVVFRDQPRIEWGHPNIRSVSWVDLNPGLLVPVEGASDLISIFLGMEPEAERVRAAEHPVTLAWRICKEKWLVVRETQLPVPAPNAAYRGLTWARIQVGLRGDDVERLGDFLNALSEGFGNRGHVVAVRTTHEGPLRPICSVPAVGWGNLGGTGDDAESSELIYATELDIIRSSGVAEAGRAEDEEAQDKSWRLMAICANWHFGVNADVVDKLDPQLGLAGFITGILHGKAVMLLIGRWLNDRAAPAVLAGSESALALPGSPGNPSMIKYVDEQLGATELGYADPDPMLVIRMNTPDRPGAILTVLESVREVFETMITGVKTTDQAPGVLTGKWADGYARALASDMAKVTMTVRLKVNPAVTPQRHPIGNWSRSDFVRFERLALTLATRKFNEAQVLSRQASPDSDSLSNTVIKVRLLRAPADRPADQPGAQPADGPTRAVTLQQLASAAD